MKTYQQIGQNPTLTDIQNPASMELADINRRKLMADVLLQQGSQMPQGQMVGNRYVAPSWTQNLNAVASKVLGAYINRDIMDKQEALANKLRQQENQDIQSFLQAGRSMPAQQQILGTETANLPQGQTAVDDEGNPTLVQPAMAARGPDYGKQLAIALKSESPTIRALGAEMLKQSITPTKIGPDESLVVRDFFGGTGGITPIATGAPKLGQELRDAARQARLDITKVDQWTDADWARVRKIEADIAAGKRPVTNVMVNTAKDISAQVGDIAKESKIQATGAVQTADAANRIIQAVDSKNLISGPGAGVRLKGAQIAEVLGLGGDTTSDKISNSRQAVQGLAQLTLQGRKQMRGEGAITESESKLAERAMSGDLDFTASEIRQLAEAAKRSAKFTYSQHQNIIKTMQNNPDAKSLVPYFDVPVDIDIFNARPVGGQSATRTKADQILQGKP